MDIAISNIAWEVDEDEAVAALLAANAVKVIDVAPGKYFPDPELATAAQIHRVRSWWQDRGIRLHGMQALLFGTSGLNMFGAEDVQAAMLRRLAAVCRVAGELGVGPLVFGSPRNRDRSGLDDAATRSTALSFFRRLGDIAATHGVTICLEPNPRQYHCNFMTTSDETAAVVREVAHAAVRMQLDTGALTINGEDPDLVVRRHAELFGHIHASEPDLVPLGDGGTDHRRMAALLSEEPGSRVVTIEMVATRSEPHSASIGRALDVALGSYGAKSQDATLRDRGVK